MAPRKLAFLKARLKSEIKTKTGLKRFLPAILSGEFEHAEVELAAWHGSGDVAVDGPGKLLHRDSPGPRADCGRRIGGGPDAVAAWQRTTVADVLIGLVTNADHHAIKPKSLAP